MNGIVLSICFGAAVATFAVGHESKDKGEIAACFIVNLLAVIIAYSAGRWL